VKDNFKGLNYLNCVGNHLTNFVASAIIFWSAQADFILTTTKQESINGS